MRRGLLLTVLLLLALAGQAQAVLFLAADASVDRGYIKLYGVGSPDLGPIAYGEQRPLGTFTLAQPLPDDAQLGPLSAGAVVRAARWRCDRLDRTFNAAGTRPDGTGETASYAVRTPSCRNRLTLDAPTRVEPGQIATVTVTDTWGTGDTDAELCVRTRCQTIRLARDQATATRTFTPHGRRQYPVTLRAPAQRLSRTVAVGVKPRSAPKPDRGPTILSTGDSMMQSIDTILGDRLAKDAEVVGDVKIGAAISSDVIVDWADLARRQVAAQHPQGTVIFLGTNDRYDMTTPAGTKVVCCGPAWSAEYTRRARGIMRTYAQDGRGTVTWLTVPAARDTRRAAGAVAVNRALVRAAAAVPTAAVLDIAKIFTPDGSYRATLTVGGKRVRVRDQDGLHLSIPGARIAVKAIIARLRADGLLS